MNVRVKEITFDKSIIEVETKSGIKELVIDRTPCGHAYEDFAEWGISDKQYYVLEALVDDVIARMSGHNELNVFWDC